MNAPGAGLSPRGERSMKEQVPPGCARRATDGKVPPVPVPEGAGAPHHRRGYEPLGGTGRAGEAEPAGEGEPEPTRPK